MTSRSSGKASVSVPERRSENVEGLNETSGRPSFAALGRKGLGALRAWFSRHAAALLYGLVALTLLAWVTRDAFFVRLITFSPGSDYWEHSATMRALMDSPWRPRNPHLDSLDPSPRFVPVFLLSALLARAFALDSQGAMAIAAVINTALFLSGIYLFFRVYFQSKIAPLLGLVVMFASWWDAWHFSNVYQLKIYFSVASYPSTTALAGTLFLFAGAVVELRASRERWFRLAVLAIGWAFVLVTHQLTATMTFSGGCLLAATARGVGWRRRFVVVGTLVAGGLLSAAWPYFSVFEVLRGGSGVAADWVDKSLLAAMESGGNESHQFYRQRGLLNTLGLALLGIPIAAYLLIRRRWFIPLGALAVATPFVANLYIEVPLGHRFILLTVFYLQLAVVWLFLRCLPQGRWNDRRMVSFLRRYAPAAAVIGVLAYFGWHNLSAARGRFEYVERRSRGGTSPYVRLGRRVAELTGANAVVLADLRTSWSLPTFGPKVVGLFHTNPLVPDEGERNYAVRRFFSSRTSDAQRREILRKYGVTHVVAKRSQANAVGRVLARSATRRRLPNGYLLYSLRDSG